MTNPSNDHESSQLKSNCQSNVQTPSAINAPVPTAVTSPVAPEPAVTTVNNNNKVIGVRPTVAADPTRKIGPKPTVLPPKPKLGTILFKQRPTGSNSISHARSHSSVDGVLGSSSGASSAMIETRLLSESNLASLQGSNRPTSTMASHPSTTSVTSTGSGRAPLAAKDELWANIIERGYVAVFTDVFIFTLVNFLFFDSILAPLVSIGSIIWKFFHVRWHTSL